MTFNTPFGKLSGKAVLTTLLVVVALIVLLAMKPFKIIADTEEGAQITWSGHVLPEPMKAGFHWMNPLNSVSVIPLTYKSMVLDNVGVPARDGFKTSMDVTVTGRFIPGSAPQVRKDTGSSEQFMNTHVVRRIMSNLNEAGRKYAKQSQSFYDEKTLLEVRDEVIAETNKELNPLGFNITAVEFSDLNLPPVIMDAITKAKVQAENVKRQQESLQIADLKAQEVVKQAESNSKATELNADAGLYKAKKEAEANESLSRSVTPSLIQYMNAQANLKWDGVRPTTEVNGGSGTILSVGK